MRWSIMLCALQGAYAVAFPVPIKTATETNTVSEIPHWTIKQGALGNQSEKIVRQLEQPSEFDFVGHPSNYDSFVFYLSEYRDGLNIRTIVDEPALARHGIRLDRIVLGELRAGGVSRRSSLRFVLDVGGLGYYVRDDKLVVTTKQEARVEWLAQLERPERMALSGPSFSERRHAAFAAGFWLLDPNDWTELLAKALNDTDREVRFDAAYALGELGPQAASAIDPLVNLLRAEDNTLREAAVYALGKIGPAATDRLFALIDNPDSAVAIAAAKSFGVMGSVARKSIPGLIDAATRHTHNEDFCRRIGSAISEIDPNGAIPALRKLLKSDSAAIRSFAAFAIGDIGPPGRDCAEELLELLSDQSTRVRRGAAFALSRIDLPADMATPALETAAKDPDELVRSWATLALRVIKSKR